LLGSLGWPFPSDLYPLCMARAACIVLGWGLAVLLLHGCSDNVPGPTEPRATPAPEITAFTFSPARVSADMLPDGWAVVGNTIEGRVMLEAEVEDPLGAPVTVAYAVVGVPPLEGTVGEGQLARDARVFAGTAPIALPATEAGYYAIIVQPAAVDGREGPPARGTLRFDPVTEED